jgi:hypothetical protein
MMQNLIVIYFLNETVSFIAPPITPPITLPGLCSVKLGYIWFDLGVNFGVKLTPNHVF